MKREAAIAAVIGKIPGEMAVIACNGHISRSLYSIKDHPGAFYMIGSMGLSPSIALGIALAKPSQAVAVFDGDGNVLMGMGCLASVATHKPGRFLHFCFDNGQHASTGGQRTVSSKVSLEKVAASAGYAWAAKVEKESEIPGKVDEMLAQKGPSFLLLKVEPGGLPEGTARVDLTPEQMTERMRKFLGA